MSDPIGRAKRAFRQPKDQTMIQHVILRATPEVHPGWTRVEIEVITPDGRHTVNKIFKNSLINSFYDQVMPELVRDLKEHMLGTNPKYFAGIDHGPTKT